MDSKFKIGDIVKVVATDSQHYNSDTKKDFEKLKGLIFRVVNVHKISKHYFEEGFDYSCESMTKLTKEQMDVLKIRPSIYSEFLTLCEDNFPTIF